MSVNRLERFDVSALPPFTEASAIEKVRLAEDSWNSRDPAKAALAYTVDSQWRNRAEFIKGRTLGGMPSYWPNSKGAWIDHDPRLAEPPLELSGAAAHRDHRVDDDHYEQPGILFRKMTLLQQQLLFENTARVMGDARVEVKQRHIANCAKADPACGAGVAKALGLTFEAEAAEQPTAFLSHPHNPQRLNVAIHARPEAC